MFLKEIQNRPPEGMMKVAFAKTEQAGHAVPEIMHLFRFKPRSTDHLVRFTEEVMRGPSSLSRGMRELIGAFISSRNQCNFCSCAHAPVAAELLGTELVEGVLQDFESSRLDRRHKALFRYLDKLARNPASIVSDDIEMLKAAGWSEEAIYDALTVAAVFKFYNTWNNGSGVRLMSSADYAHSSNRLLTMGYCMDFGWKAILRVVWAGRKEVRFSDCLELAKIVFRKVTSVVRVDQKAGVGSAKAHASCSIDNVSGTPHLPPKPDNDYKEAPVNAALVETSDSGV